MFTREIVFDNGAQGRQLELANHFVDHVPAGEDLVVTFEHAGAPRLRASASRPAWGLKFLTRKGFSVLGIKPKRVDWYRQEDLHAFLKSPALRAFLAAHRRVIWYGGSMGGYAALAFSAVHPGSTVLALNPQSTLDPRLVPWENRFPDGSQEDWRGEFADAAALSPLADRVYVAYDPFCRPDRRHVERLPASNLVHLKVPCVGHSMPVWLRQMGVLEALFDGVAQGTMSPQRFRALARQRRELPRYYVQLARARDSFALRRACIDQALQRNPADGEALQLHCRLLREEGRHADALAAAGLLPPRQRLEHLVRNYLALGQEERADAALAQALAGPEPMPVQAFRLAVALGRGRIAGQIAGQFPERLRGAPECRDALRAWENRPGAPSRAPAGPDAG